MNPGRNTGTLAQESLSYVDDPEVMDVVTRVGAAFRETVATTRLSPPQAVAAAARATFTLVAVAYVATAKVDDGRIALPDFDEFSSSVASLIAEGIRTRQDGPDVGENER